MVSSVAPTCDERVDLAGVRSPHSLLQVHALSQWILPDIELSRSLLVGGKIVIVGLLFETGVPYLLAALSCLQAR